MSYIDLHNHILPGLDDGPAGMEESIMLAQAMVKAGFSQVTATPHCFEGVPPKALIEERLAELQEELRKNKIALQVLPGAEHILEPELPQRFEEGAVLTLNRSRFLLVELPAFQPLPPYTGELIFELRLRGCYPILAHPERIDALQRDPGRLYRLVCAGALSQLTLGSITGLMGSAAARASALFMANKLCHFLATDAHSMKGRLRGTGPALKAIEKKAGPAAVEMFLKERPDSLLGGEEVDRPEPLPIYKNHLHFIKNKILSN